jgi:hypothetical protein
MTASQRNAIVSPVAGLEIYCTNCGTYGETQIYNGAFWTNLVGNSASAANPDAPTNIIATNSNQNISISFTYPVFNGGSPITSYTVTSSPGGITATGSTSPILVTGLTGASTYTFTVVATNAVGNSVSSTAVTNSGLMTSTQRNALEPSSSQTGLQVWCTDCGTNGELSIFNGTNWAKSNGQIATYAPPIAGNAICDGTRPTIVKDVSFTYNGTTYTYMDRNLGASRVATTYNDYLAYGCLYQWGRGNDGHASVNWTSSTNGSNVNGSTSVTSSTSVPGNALFITNTLAQNIAADWMTSTPSPDNRWSTLTGNNNPCPSGYRIPNLNEYSALISIYSGATNVTSWFSSLLKFPVAGFFTANLNSGGTNYEAQIVFNKTKSQMALILTSTGYYSNVGYNNRSFGYTVRCIKSSTNAY